MKSNEYGIATNLEDVNGTTFKSLKQYHTAYHQARVKEGKIQSEVWPNGDRYRGHFSDTHLQGHGTYTWEDGETHTGDYFKG